MSKVTAEFIRQQGVQLQARAIDFGRAAELAAELEVMHEVVSEAASDLDFDDEPADFQRILLRNAPPEGQTP